MCISVTAAMSQVYEHRCSIYRMLLSSLVIGERRETAGVRGKACRASCRSHRGKEGRRRSMRSCAWPEAVWLPEGSSRTKPVSAILSLNRAGKTHLPWPSSAMGWKPEARMVSGENASRLEDVAVGGCLPSYLQPGNF